MNAKVRATTTVKVNDQKRGSSTPEGRTAHHRREHGAVVVRGEQVREEVRVTRRVTPLSGSIEVLSIQ